MLHDFLPLKTSEFSSFRCLEECGGVDIDMGKPLGPTALVLSAFVISVELKMMTACAAKVKQGSLCVHSPLHAHCRVENPTPRRLLFPEP